MRLQTRAECLAYLGKHFRVVLDQPSASSDVAVGEELLRQFIFIHLKTNTEKVSLLVLMLQKLYQLARMTNPATRIIPCRNNKHNCSSALPTLRAALAPFFMCLTPPASSAQVSGQCQGDNPDSMIHQEVLLPGLLLQQFCKEKLSEWLEKVRDTVKEEAKGRPLDDPALMQKSLAKAASAVDIGRRVEYFLATGNLVSRSGLAMSQTSGFTVVAEKLNYLRYLSHFRSVHRGAYFAELRTTTARARPLRREKGEKLPSSRLDVPCGSWRH